MEGKRFDGDKIRLELLPFDALEEVGKVLTFGAKKYGDRNWELGFNYSRVLGCLCRHVFAYARGEKIDSESGLSHMAHAACNVLMLLAFEKRGVGVDDLISRELEIEDHSPAAPCIFTKIARLGADQICYEWYWRIGPTGLERGPFRTETEAREDYFKINHK